MFDPSVDIALGIPVEHRAYADGEAGIQDSLKMICKKVRQGMTTAAMQSFAGNVLVRAGAPSSTAQRATAFLEFVRANAIYVPDPLGTEKIQSAMVTLCVEGAPVCIPCGDCFPEGTLLLRRDGQLVPIEEIKVGDEIWGDKKWSRVEGKAFKGKLKVDAVEMNNGSTMYLTPDHKVYAGRCKHGKSVDCSSCHAGARTESFERIRVGDLQIGETLLQPERVAFGKHGSNGKMYVTALALADGWAEPEYKRFKIAGKDGHRKEAQKKEVALICEQLNVETRWHRRYITVKDEAWAQEIGQLGERARFKHLETLDLDEGAAGEALRGLMADSTANTNGPGRTFSTTSYALMVQVRVLQRMFGRSTSVKMLTPEQHRGAGKHPLWRVGVRAAGERTDKTLAVRSIERAVKKVPCWDIQTDDHKVYLPEHDVTVSNCDDLVCALATMCAAVGMEVEIVRQRFAPDIHGVEPQQHVLVEVHLEDGRWYPLDPSTKTFPAGSKARAASETRCSPWDSSITGISDQAEFIGIGALPVYMQDGEGNFYKLDENQTVEENVKKGLGAIWAGAAALQPQMDWLGVAWKLVDPLGRTWAQTMTSATTRAAAKNWKTGDAASRYDLLALIVASTLQARALQGFPDVGEYAGDLLIRTWLVELKRIGVDPAQYRKEDLRAAIAKQGQANVTLFEFLVVVAGALTTALIVGTAMYLVAQLVDNLLSRNANDNELIRLHTESQKIVDKHLADGTPYTDDEKEQLKRLQAMQEELAQFNKPGHITVSPTGSPKDEPTSPWVWAGIATIIGGTILAVMYRDEIRAALSSRKRLAA